MEKEAETIPAQNQKTMPTLTIFTPAYNRAHTLPRTYESLCRQTLQDFEWLVIDDGSTDNTRQLVEKWIAQGKIPIRYIYQENQGMHGAHNTAYDNIHTELNTCIDSDDYMPDDAVEIIVKFWQENGTKNFAGLVGLDITPNGKVIGSVFKEKQTTLWNFYRKGGSGDKKLVYRTDVIKRYPEYPIFEGEKYVSLGSKYFMIDQDYELLTLNKPLVIVDYQLDGSSYNMYRNYVNNPKGFIYIRKQVLSTHLNLYLKLRYCIHYIANKIIAKESTTILSDSPCKVSTFFMLPFGYIWYRIIMKKFNAGARLKMKN